jgi:hypothetical protein
MLSERMSIDDANPQDERMMVYGVVPIIEQYYLEV